MANDSQPQFSDIPKDLLHRLCSSGALAHGSGYDDAREVALIVLNAMWEAHKIVPVVNGGTRKVKFFGDESDD